MSHLPAPLPSLQDGQGAGAQDKRGKAGRPGLIQPGEEKAKGEAVPAVLPYEMDYIREKMEPEVHSGSVQGRGCKLQHGKCK